MNKKVFISIPLTQTIPNKTNLYLEHTITGNNLSRSSNVLILRPVSKIVDMCLGSSRDVHPLSTMFLV